MPHRSPNDVVELVIDNNDDSIEYSKGWHTKDAPEVHYTEQPTATASISFNGSFVTVFGIVPSCNEFPTLSLNATTVLRSSYQINDGPPEFFNTTLNAERLTDQVFFQPNTTLSDGPHTLVITNLNGPLILDYLSIVPADGQSSSSSLSANSSMNYQKIWKIDDTSTHITYDHGEALFDTDPDDYNSTLHSLSYPGSTASLNFNGHFVAVYGAFPKGGILPDVSFTLDNIVQTVLSGHSSPSSLPRLSTTRRLQISQVLFWQSSPLSDDRPHNLSISTQQGEFLLDFILIGTKETASPFSPPQAKQFYPSSCATLTSPTLRSSDTGSPASIVGGVLGTVSLILIVCIVYLLSKQWSCWQFWTRSHSEAPHQTSVKPTSPCTTAVRDGTRPYHVDGSGRPVKFHIPDSSVASYPPSYRSRSEVYNRQDVDPRCETEKKEEIPQYGHDEKFAIFQQL